MGPCPHFKLGNGKNKRIGGEIRLATIWTDVVAVVTSGHHGEKEVEDLLCLVLGGVFRFEQLS